MQVGRCATVWLKQQQQLVVVAHTIPRLARQSNRSDVGGPRAPWVVPARRGQQRERVLRWRMGTHEPDAAKPCGSGPRVQ